MQIGQVETYDHPLGVQYGNYKVTRRSEEEFVVGRRARNGDTLYNFILPTHDEFDAWRAENFVAPDSEPAPAPVTPEHPTEDKEIEDEIGSRVVTRLACAGYQASYEYPGYICVVGKTCEWNIGTANAKWDADLVPCDCRENGTVLSRMVHPDEKVSEDDLFQAIVSLLEMGMQNAPIAFVRAYVLCERITDMKQERIDQPVWFQIRDQAQGIINDVTQLATLA